MKKKVINLDTARRIKSVLVDPRVLVHMFTTGQIGQCIKGIPAGARFVGFYACSDRQAIVVGVEHETFDLVPLGERAKFVVPEFRRIQGGA